MSAFPLRPGHFRLRFPGAKRHRLLPGAAVVAFAGLAVTLTLLVTGASSQAQFAHAAFKSTWDRTDGPVASTAVKRPWVWGPVPGKAIGEPFAGLPGNSHLVQYFDKGRMEINNPAGDPKDPFYVTNGRLAIELISGLMQTGLQTFDNRGAANIALASDSDDPTAPTYRSFNAVSSIPGAQGGARAGQQLGQVVRTAIDRQGVVQTWPQDHPDYGVRIVYYEPTTGHNIPDVFWDYLNQQGQISDAGRPARGPLFFPWMSVSGYPVSEPYWSYVKVGGRYTDVLIQAFERRVLTFVPHLPSPFKVQMGNIGQHYYDWRYLNAGAPGPAPALPTPTAVALPPKAQVSLDEIAYRKSLIDLNGNYCTLTNRGQEARSLDGWWLDSPKWDHVDRFYFPKGILLAPGASLKVHAGPGPSTATDVYMNRTAVMWDSQPYDFAVLYDQYGREVSRFFPAAEVGPPPTAPVGGTPPPAGTETPATVTQTPTPGTPVPATASPVGTGVPSPVPTSPGGLTPVASPSVTPSGTTTPTSTPSGHQ